MKIAALAASVQHSAMSPLLRLWGIGALCVALLLLLRGAFALALACFLFSPAPVLLFTRGGFDQGTLSLSWLRRLVIVVFALCAVFALVVYLGGIPQVHQMPAANRGPAP
jgi:hypothetical protein